MAEQRPRRALELDHLAGQLVDAPRHRRIAVEDLRLDLVDVLLDAGDDRRIAVDDGVEDGVQNRLRTHRQQLRVVFHALAHG